MKYVLQSINRYKYCGAGSWRLKFFIIFSLMIMAEKARTHSAGRHSNKSAVATKEDFEFWVGGAT